MNKKLDTNAISNKLVGSVFFSQKRASQKASTHTAEQKPDTSRESANPPISERPNDGTPVRPNGSRIITRNSFETYEDQMKALRKLSFHEKMQGRVGSMSQMVREAIE